MYIKINNFSCILLKSLIHPTFWLMLFFSSFEVAVAGKKFISKSPCADTDKVCVKGAATKIIDGFEVYKDCWEWSYTKTCKYPSKNDCGKYKGCHFVSNGRCLLFDSQGDCVNQEREFSCKTHEFAKKENKTIRQGLVAKVGEDNLICKGAPCLDGNCVDKGYLTNGQMMDSISKLYAFSAMKPDGNGNFNLWQGTNQHCSKKVAEYANCCRENMKGWGKEIGAGCTKDEKQLADNRSKNLCVYVGKVTKKTLGIPTVVKHHFCCFGTLLDKVIQVEGRKQLGKNFGSGGNPNCRGLTLEEIQAVDFGKIDFTEFIEDFKVKFAGKYNPPSAEELGSKAGSNQSNILKYDNNPRNTENNMTGVSKNIDDEGEY